MSALERGLQAGEAVDRSVTKIAGFSMALVAANVLLILGFAYTPVAQIGLLAFSNFIVGILVFGATVGGGYWLASTGIDRSSLPMAAGGVALSQFGYGLLGSAILVGYAPGAQSLWVQALGITAVVTGLLTAGIAAVVFSVDHSFERWQRYSFYCFGGGIVVGLIGYVLTPLLLVLASLLFFVGFLVDLVYEIWAVRESHYASELRNAIGIYVAVMGVFIHILQVVLRLLSLLQE